MSEPIIRIVDTGLVSAFDSWAVARGLRGHDISDTVMKVMRYWVGKAYRLVIREKADPEQIRAHLLTLTTAYSRVSAHPRTRLRGGKTANALRGTLAAAIVAILDYKGARLKAGVGDDQGYYASVNRFIGARAYSAGLHAAGFNAAFNVLGKDRLTSVNAPVPRYKHSPGSIEHQLTGDIASILVENFASAAASPFNLSPRGARGLYPGMFADSFGEVQALIAGYLRQDMINAALASGFDTPASNLIGFPGGNISLAA